MDIRNITEQAPKVEGGKYLEAIWDLQKELLEGYIGKIEKDLPMYPIDIHTFKGQQVLKDFSARVIEETAEGYESTTAALELVMKHGFNPSQLDDQEFEMLLNHLQNSNEEQSDAIAFYISLLLYANISIQDIYDYASRKFIGKGFKYNSLRTLMSLGRLLQDKYIDVPEENRYIIIDQDILIHYCEGRDVDHVLSYIPAFTKSSLRFHECEDHMLWSVCYHINIGRNFLKNKPWKQTQEFTDVTRYAEQLVLGFIKYLGYLKAVGFNEESLYVLCFKKNRVNHFRQKSGY